VGCAGSTQHIQDRYQQVKKCTATIKMNMIKLSTNIRINFKKHPILSLSIASVLIILTGTIFYHLAEGLRWIDALYFSVITITTVGYGDFSPQTDVGKLFTIVYILNGIGIIFGFINAINDRRMSKNKTEKK